MKKIFQFLRRLFRRKNPDSICWIQFEDIEEGSKSGADIWGTDWPIPVSDVLSYKLLIRGNEQYVITSVESKILFIIPFHYDEYIIEIPRIKYEKGNFGAKEALDEIHDAENWNKGERLRPTGFEGYVTFQGCDREMEYECGNNDYIWLKEK